MGVSQVAGVETELLGVSLSDDVRLEHTFRTINSASSLRLILYYLPFIFCPELRSFLFVL